MADNPGNGESTESTDGTGRNERAGDTDPKNDDSQRAHRAGAFDIRTFIALLIGIYGLILVVTGLFFTSESDLEKSAGFNVNLWAGIGMVAVAAVMQTWARLRPTVVPDDFEAPEESRPPGH